MMKLLFSKTLLASILVLSLGACSSTPSPHVTPTLDTKPTVQTPTVETQKVNQVVFLNRLEAVQRFVQRDNYFKQFSPFDWQARFDGKQDLDEQALANYYAKDALDWQPKYKQKVLIAVAELEKKIAPLNLNRPKNLTFILSNGKVEFDAAYTRDDYIVLPTGMLEESQDHVTRLVAHEFFHVYSRYNRADRDALYATINAVKIPPLQLPTDMQNLRLTNPDAPTDEYGYSLTYQGERHTFVPVLSSFIPFQAGIDLPFEFYIRNKLLAVETVNNQAFPKLDANGHLIYVDKDATNFDTVVMPNSSYLNQPEEVLAENFALWVMDDPVTHSTPIKRLIKTMQNIH